MHVIVPTNWTWSQGLTRSAGKFRLHPQQGWPGLPSRGTKLIRRFVVGLACRAASCASPFGWRWDYGDCGDIRTILGLNRSDHAPADAHARPDMLVKRMGTFAQRPTAGLTESKSRSCRRRAKRQSTNLSIGCNPAVRREKSLGSCRAEGLRGPSDAKRFCHRQTQVLDLPVSRMIAFVPSPSALISTICWRHTCFCGALRLGPLVIE